MGRRLYLRGELEKGVYFLEERDGVEGGLKRHPGIIFVYVV